MSHLQIFFVPLNDRREAVTLESFPPGTIFSIGLHPLRNGRPAGGRGGSGLFRCPPKTPPAAGRHCDSVSGAAAHGKGALPKATHTWMP